MLCGAAAALFSRQHERLLELQQERFSISVPWFAVDHGRFMGYVTRRPIASVMRDAVIAQANAAGFGMTEADVVEETLIPYDDIMKHDIDPVMILRALRGVPPNVPVRVFRNSQEFITPFGVELLKQATAGARNQTEGR
jgi:hypothetical protein